MTDEKRRQLVMGSPYTSLIISYKDEKMLLDAHYMSIMSGLVHDFVMEGTPDGSSVNSFVDLSALKPDAEEAAGAEDKGKGWCCAAHMKIPEGLFTEGGWNALVEVVSLLYGTKMFLCSGDLLGLFEKYPVKFSMPEDSVENRGGTYTSKSLCLCTCDSLLDAARSLRADMVTKLVDKAIVTFLKDCVPGLFNGSNIFSRYGAASGDAEIIKKSQKVMTSVVLANVYGLSNSWTYFLDQAKKCRGNSSTKMFVRDLVSFYKDHEKTMDSETAMSLLVAMI